MIVRVERHVTRRSINSTEREDGNTLAGFISNHYHPMSLPTPSLRAHRAPPSSSRLPKRPEVYVLVPHSPYSPYASETIGSRTADGSHHNLPTPLREHNMPIAESPLAVIKRKRSEGNLGEREQRAPETNSKRPKVSTMTNKTQGSTKPTRTVASTATEEFPNGSFYCHQCNKKRDSSGDLRLSLIMSLGTSLKPFPSRVILHLQDQVLSLGFPLQGQVL